MDRVFKLYKTDLYNKMMQLKAKGKQFVLVLTRNTIEQLLKDEMPEANVDVDNINTAEMQFAGTHVYMGTMDKIVIIEGEVWLR